MKRIATNINKLNSHMKSVHTVEANTSSSRYFIPQSILGCYDELKTTTRCHTVGTVSKSNRKIVKTVKLDIPSTQIHDRPFSCLGTLVHALQ